MSQLDVILNEFRERLPVYSNLKDDIEDILQSVVKTNGIKVSNLSIRLKREKSLMKKIIYKNKYQHIEDITDVVACRIITLFEDDVEKLKMAIAENFEVVELSDRRKKENQMREEYGYNSLHIIVKFTEERCSLVEYAPYKDIAFEIQIRTALQHAWCEIEHGLGYKSDYEIPKHIRRRLNRLSAMIELLDEEFVSIASEVETYNNGLEHQEKIMKTDINFMSLKKYVLKNPFINHLMKDLAEEYSVELEYDPELLSQFRVVQRLNYMGYGYIHELDELICTHERQIRFIAKTWMELLVKDKVSFNYYLCVVWITICNMMETGNKDIDEFINKETIEKIENSEIISLPRSFN